MSFMFNPYPHEDLSAVNRPKLSKQTVESIVSGGLRVCEFIAKRIADHLESGNRSYILCLDGFVSAQFDSSVEIIRRALSARGIKSESIAIDNYYKKSDELEAMLARHLQTDREKDPILLFGSIFHGTLEDYFDKSKLKTLEQKLKECSASVEKTCRIVYGIGSGIRSLRQYYSDILYYDVTPFTMTLRIRGGETINIGDEAQRSLRERFRRFYYCDYEVGYKLRDDLLREDVDFYVDSNKFEDMKLLPKGAFDEIMGQLARYPFRCKPVYNEGIWGGYFVHKLRSLPRKMKNCAWVFDLIPNEVSILVQAGDALIDFPYLTFVKKEGEAIMGKECKERFKGIFPIRCNYDDTYHSNGNMSIQVHPPFEYATEEFGEDFQQDEAYYVVATGHGAKTYLGLQDGCDSDDFIDQIVASEKQKTPVDYDRYVNSIPSRPGTQLLIPGGTVHASGRNQVVLELGSCTMGSMTFKLYDYLRSDLDGRPRPIHSVHGKAVLQGERTRTWVLENLVQEPVLVAKGKGWEEYQVGDYKSMFFKQHRYQFDESCEGNTEGWFHILALVDGERVRVEAKNDSSRMYEMSFLDILVVPQSIGAYRLVNIGKAREPVVVYKIMCKKDFKIGAVTR